LPTTYHAPAWRRRGPWPYYAEDAGNKGDGSAVAGVSAATAVAETAGLLRSPEFGCRRTDCGVAARVLGSEPSPGVGPLAS
jgi:hypothetical protein